MTHTVTLAIEARHPDDCAMLTVLYDLCRYATPIPLFANLTLANAYFCAGDLRSASYDLNTAQIMLAKAEQEAAKQAKFNAQANTAGQG